jgi:hypothetical protein
MHPAFQNLTAQSGLIDGVEGDICEKRGIPAAGSACSDRNNLAGLFRANGRHQPLSTSGAGSHFAQSAPSVFFFETDPLLLIPGHLSTAKSVQALAIQFIAVDPLLPRNLPPQHSVG